MFSTIASTPTNVIPANSRAQNMPETEAKQSASSSEKNEQTKAQELQQTLQLTEQELHEIESLKSTDREVKRHEQAHLSAAGSFATGGASFTYKQGPNGVRYAVAGEVQIDTSTVPGDPAATMRKADAIKRAALAPAQPSGQDQSVAAQAASMATKAQTELIKMNSEMISKDKEGDEQHSQAVKININA